ncbi:helix-turn-helix transcriptional regulator [Roseovarius sp.]|uniref:helix-turn-helix transcriptional regulator n=1 Tax=Roseovarius sp. TaxID=1486281 RepID=UPI003564A8E7
MSAEPTPLPDTLMNMKAVTVALSRSRASIYRDIKAGIFPKALKVRGSSKWRASQVQEFIDGLQPDQS